MAWTRMGYYELVDQEGLNRHSYEDWRIHCQDTLGLIEDPDFGSI